MWPPPASNIAPVLVLDLCVRTATRGTIHSGFSFARTSGGITVSVIRLAAIGAMTLQRMLYLKPSFARVSVKPTRASLAAVLCVSTCACLEILVRLTRVVRLAERAEKTSGRGGADEPAILLFPEVRPCSSCALVCSKNVNLIDEVPISLLHVLEADVAQDTSVVDEDIDTPKGINGSLNDPVSILNRVIVGNCVTTC